MKFLSTMGELMIDSAARSRLGNSSWFRVRREVSPRLSEEFPGTKLSLARYGYEKHALVLKSKTRTLNKPSCHVDHVSNSHHMQRPKHASPSIRSTKSVDKCLRRSSPEIFRWRTFTGDTRSLRQQGAPGRTSTSPILDFCPRQV